MKFLILIAFSALLVAGINSYLGPDDLSGCGSRPSNDKNCQAADVIVAISGGDTTARTKEAVRLYQDGWASRIIFSGAAQDMMGPSNASVMRNIAVGYGVSEKNIVIEERSRTTKQNADLTKALLTADRVSSVILVTSSYHQRRASLEFQRSFDGINIRNHPTREDEGWSTWWWMKPGGWYLAIGELAKITILGIWSYL